MDSLRMATAMAKEERIVFHFLECTSYDDFFSTI